jgi:hypothetical protein
MRLSVGPPNEMQWWRTDLNRRPAGYESAALNQLSYATGFEAFTVYPNLPGLTRVGDDAGTADAIVTAAPVRNRRRRQRIDSIGA